MQNSSKTRTWANDDTMATPAEQPTPVINQLQSTTVPDEEPPQPKKFRTQDRPTVAVPDHSQPMVVDQSNDVADATTAAQEAEPEAAPVSDMDWLRSKTSRLLGLLDEDEQAEFEERKVNEPVEPQSTNNESRSAAIEDIGVQHPTNEDIEEAAAQTTPEQDANIDLIRVSARLFLRNLAYDLTEADLQPLFAPFGKLEEVSAFFRFLPFSTQCLSYSTC